MLASSLGKDLDSLLRDFKKFINDIVVSKTDPLTLNLSDFRPLINDYIKELERMGDLKLNQGRQQLIDLNNRIKTALEFNYPIDYQMFPQTVVPSSQLLGEVGALLKQYREGKISEKTLRHRIQFRFGVPLHQVDAYINTQYAGFDNSANKTVADLAGLRKAVYGGTIGPNTRIFCRRLLENPALYTEDEIRKMDNGQGLPVIRYCGGYRCMHEWWWVDEDWGVTQSILNG